MTGVEVFWQGHSMILMGSVKDVIFAQTQHHFNSVHCAIFLLYVSSCSFNNQCLRCTWLMFML